MDPKAKKYRMSELQARKIAQEIREILRKNGIHHKVEEVVNSGLSFINVEASIKVTE